MTSGAGVLDAYAAREEREERDRKRNEAIEKQLRADVQALMAQEPMRRVLWRFLSEAGVDVTAYRSDSIPMSHAIGWQDAGRWWLAAIQEHCPEREVQMRAEARREAREGATDEVEDGR